MRTVGRIWQFETGGNGTFEICFGLWREYKSAVTRIRRDEDKETKDNALMISRWLNWRIYVYYSICVCVSVCMSLWVSTQTFAHDLPACIPSTLEQCHATAPRSHERDSVSIQVIVSTANGTEGQIYNTFDCATKSCLYFARKRCLLFG